MGLPEHQEGYDGQKETQDGEADTNDGEDAESVGHKVWSDGTSGGWTVVYQTSKVGEVTAGTRGLSILHRDQLTTILHPATQAICSQKQGR